MLFKTGKHAGMSTEEVLLKEPDFAQWYVSKYPDAKHAKDFKRLIRVFDAKPLLKKCSCDKVAIYANASEGSASLMFRCDSCSLYSGARGLSCTIDSFGQALGHIDLTFGGTRGGKRTIVRELAEAKGLPRRVGKTQAEAFFAPPKANVLVTTLWGD